MTRSLPAPPAHSWFLALRYLTTRWVSLLCVAGVAVAVWALIVVIAVFSGFIGEIRGHVRAATADLVLTAVRRDSSYAALRAVLEADPDVVATAPRLRHYGILFPYGGLRRQVVVTRAADWSALGFNYVDLIGVDPELEARTTRFRDWLRAVPPGQRVDDPDHPFEVSPERQRSGALLAGQRPPDGAVLRSLDGILLGLRRMTKGETVFPGQVVDLVSARVVRDPGAEDPDRRERVVKIKRPFAVAGAFETKHRVFDDTFAFVHVETLREMLGHGMLEPDSIDLVTEVAIRARPGVDLVALAARLEDRVRGIAGPHAQVLTWEEQNAVFLGAVEHERALMKLVLFAVMMVAGFLIYATLHMMVTQKIKDIGILASMGATPGGIGWTFLLAGVVIGAVGCALGATSGALSAVYLNDVNDWARVHFDVELFPTRIYALERVPYSLEPGWITQVLAAAMLLSILVSWLPARRAARLDPVTTLSYE